MTQHHSYRDRDWVVQPVAEAALQEVVASALAACLPAAAFARRLLAGCAVRLRDIIDHIEFNDDAVEQAITRAGWIASDDRTWINSSGRFPPFLRGGCPHLRVAITVESVDRFLQTNSIKATVEGKLHGLLRRADVFVSERATFAVVERSGYAGFSAPDVSDGLVRSARLHLQAFRARRRQFDQVEQGLAHTEALVDAAVADIGPHWACELWLRAEREFWMLRCAAGRMQKARQDSFGIGWCNIDHHTYDSSRRHYRHTIGILEKLGYELREMIYAGELAGWGSQILEQPVIGSTIFADVDLAPDELDLDFAHEVLPELPKKRRAGLVSALHGESILEAGLNHVAFLFNQEMLRAQFEAEGVRMMDPFSSFPHLYQELTVGDWAAVDPKRVDALELEGHLDPAEAEKVRLDGAIVAHLENIERNDGFKGFNKPGIDGVLRKLDPRSYEPMRAAPTATG